MKNLIYILIGILLLSVIGCSANKQVTSSTFTFTAEEENDLQKVAYQSLSNSIKKEIIDEEQVEVTGFKSGSKLEVFNNKNSNTIDIKNTQTILVNFTTKEKSKFKSINVYLEENGEKVLGFLTEDK
ncbi:hypothetical protein ACIQ4I_02985 [Rummeliibacillus sp. NPDC094406]|uniref:hypothetical protein n=1 Tax=Rummeliibacillus sp. NPDC094406 TaxID=3364511 RepID=UPI00380EF823